MSENQDYGPLRPGDQAPEVVLDAVGHEGKVALHDFRGRSPVLIGLFRGLHCPFCRRQIAAFGQPHRQRPDAWHPLRSPLEPEIAAMRARPRRNEPSASCGSFVRLRSSCATSSRAATGCNCVGGSLSSRRPKSASS